MTKKDGGCVEYTLKELLVKQDCKIDDLHTKIDELLVTQATTNGKVRLHTKAIFSLASIIATLAVAFIALT